MNKRMKYIGILLVLVFGIPLATYFFVSTPSLPDPRSTEISQYAQWIQFTPKSQVFTVKVPTPFQEFNETMPLPSSNNVIRYNMYVTQSQAGTTFMITVIEYPYSLNVNDQQKALDNIIKEMIAGNANNTLIYNTQTSFLQFASKDFMLSNPQGFIRVRAFIKDNMIFILSVADRTDEQVEKYFQQFVNSFTLK